MIKKLIKFISLLDKKPAEEKNIDAYSSGEIIAYYSRQKPDLQPAEKAILEVLQHKLPECTMLDIGVGAGRTTAFFAPLVKHYTGIDYAVGMVEVCKKIYPAYRFEEGDVRHLQFEGNTFDFVLFSFNGLDSISATDRITGLKEINRVLKPGGCFVFSAHNIKATDHLFTYRGINPKKWYKTLVLRKVNKEFKTFSEKNEVIVFDGTLGYQVSNYYIAPSHQLNQLAHSGFTNIDMFSRSGIVLTNAEAGVSHDLWIYYVGYKA